MSTFNSPHGRIRARASAAALACAVTGLLCQSAAADSVRPTPVPTDIQVPAGNRAFLEARGIGTQNYICLPAGAGFAWSLFTPEAVLLSDFGKQITTHFFSPNPFEKNTDPTLTAEGPIRAAWRHSRDTSTVWARAVAVSSDPVFVRPNSVPWLKLEVVGAQRGPTGGDTLKPTTFLQRINTSGGVAPTKGCAETADIGKKAFIPYEADYVFFRKVNDGY
jgi:hypothetical protein